MQAYNYNYDSICHPAYGRWTELNYQNIILVINLPVLN